MDEQEKNEVLAEFMEFSKTIENITNPFEIASKMGVFFDGVWQRGYNAGVEIKKEMDNLNQN